MTESKSHDSTKSTSKTEVSERDTLFPILAIYRKRAFKEQDSLMEKIFSVPTKDNPNLYGFYNLFVLLLIIFAATHPVVHYIYHGDFFNLRLYNKFQQDFFWVISTWPIFSIWSYTAFGIHKLVMKGMPIWLMYILQHLTQTAMFFVSSYVIISRDWCQTHTIFISFQCCIHFMKMHSYTMTNFFLREEWLEGKKRGWKQLSPYPNNVTLQDFTTYMAFPVLVYWHEYPRSKSIRWLYVVEKAFFAALGILALYLIAVEIIIPVFDLGPKINFIQAIFVLMIPTFICWVIGFFTIWDCILNVFAEVTRFADREFYQDWWNVSNYDSFNRKWNKIVHEFLFRHVYAEAMLRWKWAASTSYYFTFLFSGLLHEYLSAILFRKIKPLFLTLILAQLPYTAIMGKIVKNHPERLKNLIFWTGLSFGLPLITSMYLSENFA